MMKKIAAITMMLMLLFSGITINIASHYCGGNLTGTQVSLSGKLASCGMEDLANNRTTQETFSGHCCENVISSVRLNNTYVPAWFSHLTAPAREIVQIYAIPHKLLSFTEAGQNSCEEGKSPPGLFCPVNVEQQLICVFRI